LADPLNSPQLALADPFLTDYEPHATCYVPLASSLLVVLSSWSGAMGDVTRGGRGKDPESTHQLNRRPNNEQTTKH
jgi:hypothetical protein